MSTETESARACLGHLCLVAKPENPEQAGWRDGYCPDCQDELARDEIRAERQDARNEVEIETPITDDAYQQRNGESHFEHVVRKQETMESLERQLAEARQLAEDAVLTCRAIKDKYGLGDRHVMREKNAEIETLKSQLAEAKWKLEQSEAAFCRCKSVSDEISEQWRIGEESLKKQLAEANSENQRLTADMILHERMSIQFMEQRDRLAEELRDIRDELPATTVPQWILECIDETLATLDQKP